ncbi:ABC transporter ATP-binding protein [Alsobacter sp. SYSU M60028]|uniref:ABC transporter ATP-binding protein n=1 Tax=Alsobacter ponti TaxID=2962936 RepID=A0ABT1LGN3_9HYPH|nr:ABC transporter transmembrane domain-containing protein [Alsobacter ponti]MCP8940273.1 ABC transporter ATP-binding protein [Alsobacter ponti]
MNIAEMVQHDPNLAAPAARSAPVFSGATMPKTLLGFVWEVSARHQFYLSLLSVLVFVLSTAPLEVQRRIVNDAFKGGDYVAIIWLALIYLGLALGEGLLKLVMNIYRAWVGEVSVLSLRMTVHRLIHGLPEELSSAEALGVETSMMLSESEPIGGFVGVYVSEPMMQGGILISVFSYMIYLQPLMALVAFVVFCPQIVFVPLIQRAINRRVARRIKTLREVSMSMIADPAGVGVLGRAQEDRIGQVFGFNMGIYKLKFSMNFFMNILHHSGTALVLGIGGWFVVRGQTEIGTVVAFVSGLTKINDPWGDLVNWFRDLTVTETKYRLIANAIQMLADAKLGAGREPADIVE